MSQNGSVHSALIYKINALSCQIVHTVCVNIFFIQQNLCRRLFYIQNSLKHNSCAVLNKLSHRMQVCGQIHCCRENTLLILAFTFSEQLLPPLRYIMQAGLVVCYDLYVFALSQKNIADCGIQQSIIGLIGSFQSFLSSGSSAFHQFINIQTCCSDRKKTYCCQYGETASYIIRNYEGLIALFISQILQCASCLVCGCINTLVGFLTAIFFNQHLLKYTESNRRLCGCSGFGNNVDREILSLQYIL